MANLIACLYPSDDITQALCNTVFTIDMAENVLRRFEPLIEDCSRRSSQASEDEISNYNDNNNDDNYYDQESEEINKTPNNDYNLRL